MITGSTRRRWTVTAARYGALVLAAAVLALPFVYMVSTSLKPRTLLLEYPPTLVPADPTLANYATAWGANNFGRYFLNSASVALATTVCTVLLASMMAYSFARFRYPGRGVLFATVVLGLTIPTMLLIIPQFLLAKDLGLIDSLPGLVPFYVGTQLAFTTFLLRAFFERIPRELDEAMLIDGAGAWRRYWNLALPLSKPALATTGIFVFLGSWDEFVWALTVINDVSNRTLPIGIALFRGQHGTSWGLVFAASVIAVLPVVVVYVLFQRHIVSGLTSGALKG
ncbi:carbohydrate ABC transporter permease [Cellulomonas sp. APG4]|uniref:carbohydrate ABC transporter permease n=1 Tax=Cellulomonas sp. APG4 TaxID=1538656 RepID=UPI00137AF689|nr:carbohydrate ABC transporter permease [Cellulomonas sp. APG4]NCT90460.1 carbohydrate ABC transporter permease [Cellulomonas sp. APG4]